MSQCLERPDHQAGANEQHEGQRHLHDDERAARAMTFAARARRASAAAQSGRDVRAGVLEHRNRAEEQAGDARHGEGEQQDHRVDRDVVEARQIAWRQRDEHAHRAVREAEPGDAADETEHDALGQQFVRDASAARAERRPNGQLLLPPFCPDEQQVRDVRARDQQHHADRPHQHPEHRSDVANQIGLEQPHHRRELRLFEQLLREPRERWVALDRHWDQARSVGRRLLDGHTRLQPRDGGVVEHPEVHVAGIEPHRQDDRGLLIEKTKRVGQHADDLERGR